MQGAFHQHLHFAFTSQFYGSQSCAAAIVGIDNLDCSQIKLQSLRNCSDFRLSTNKNRNNQLVFESLHGPAQRYFVTRPDNRSPDGRFCGGSSNQAMVAPVGIVHNQLRYWQGRPA
jgi:hypothetical protein